MCEHVLGLEPLTPEERPKPKVAWAEKEHRNLTAAAFDAQDGCGRRTRIRGENHRPDDSTEHADVPPHDSTGRPLRRRHDSSSPSPSRTV